MKKITFILLFMLMLGCKILKLNYFNTLDFEIVQLNGIIQYHYVNDYEQFYIKEVVYLENSKSYDFQESFRFIGEYCNADTVFKIFDTYQNPNKDISDFPQYYAQNISNPQAGVYYGGDIYYTNEQKDIAIAFHLIGKGIIFHSVCKDYIKYENYYEDCPIKPSEIKTPFIAFLEVDTIYSLNAEQQKMCQLTKSNLKSFTVNLCE